ncbi:MAG: DUF5666 domain-containing protein, partial [Anaerolineae bacterium]
MKALGILLTLLTLLAGASYSQEPEPYRDAPGQAVIRLQPGAGTHYDGGKYEEYELYGFVESMPEGSFIGAWVVNGTSFEATASTEFLEDDGPLQVWAYVKVKYYVSGDVNYATWTETEGGGAYEEHELY